MSDLPPFLETPHYYRLNPSRLSFSECLRFVGLPGGVFVWTLYRLGLGKENGPARFALRLPVYWHDMAVSPGALSVRCLEQMQEAIGAMERLGFHSPVYQRMVGEMNLDRVDTGACILRHPNGECVATVVYMATRLPPPRTGIMEQVMYSLSASFPNGTLTIASTRAMHDPPPGSRNVYQSGSPADLWQTMESAMSRLRGYAEPMPARTEADIALGHDAHMRRMLMWNVHRGVWLPMSDAEVADLRTRGEFRD
jgi:hypothetical protein